MWSLMRFKWYSKPKHETQNKGLKTRWEIKLKKGKTMEMVTEKLMQTKKAKQIFLKWFFSSFLWWTIKEKRVFVREQTTARHKFISYPERWLARDKSKLISH